MRVCINPPNSHKISLSQIQRYEVPPHNQDRTLVLPSHISWEQQPIIYKSVENNINTNIRPKSRKRIFDKKKSNSKSREKIFRDNSPSFVNSKNVLRLNEQQNCLNLSQNEKRIEELTQQLKIHRQNMSNSKVPKRQCKAQCQTQEISNWTKIQQKLSESRQIIKRQQQFLENKIPIFQKKLQDNNTAISEVKQLIKRKFELQDNRAVNLMQMMAKNEGRLKSRDNQLDKINSELLLKESQIMKNKYQNRKRELELERIKRIEDLQNRNLELYQQIEKSRLHEFQDYVPEEEFNANYNECWGENDSKLSVNKLSTINNSKINMSTSRNYTIGELLSPLTLSEHQYII